MRITRAQKHNLDQLLEKVRKSNEEILTEQIKAVERLNSMSCQVSVASCLPLSKYLTLLHISDYAISRTQSEMFAKWNNKRRTSR